MGQIIIDYGDKAKTILENLYELTGVDLLNKIKSRLREAILLDMGRKQREELEKNSFDFND